MVQTMAKANRRPSHSLDRPQSSAARRNSPPPGGSEAQNWKKRAPEQLYYPDQSNENTPLLSRPKPASTPRQFHSNCEIITLCAIAFHILLGLFIFAFFYSPDRSIDIIWGNLAAARECSAVGARMYTASYTVEGLHLDIRCADRPIQIHGKYTVHPVRCSGEQVEREVLVRGERQQVTYTIIRGEWLVDWDEEECVPTWEGSSLESRIPADDEQCLNHRERGYTAYLAVPRIPLGLGPLDACKHTPVTIHGQQVFASQCQMVSDNLVRARFFVEEQDCVPVWMNVTSQECTSIGVRKYTAVSSHTPSGYHPDTHCVSRPVVVAGKSIPRPFSCRSEAVEIDGHIKTVTTGVWLVADDRDCVPTLDAAPTPDDRCVSYGSREYHGFITLSRVPWGLDPLDSCRALLFELGGKLVKPHVCSLEGDVVHARFLRDQDASCATAFWSDVKGDWLCEEYGLKRYTGFLKDVPAGLDGLDVCRQVRHTFFGMEDRNLLPGGCEMDRENVRGWWMINFHVPECHPTMRDVRDWGCTATNRRHISARLDDIGNKDDWYRICTTTPYDWRGTRYLPTNCESKGPGHWKYALYNVNDPSCT